MHMIQSCKGRRRCGSYTAEMSDIAGSTGGVNWEDWPVKSKKYNRKYVDSKVSWLAVYRRFTPTETSIRKTAPSSFERRT